MGGSGVATEETATDGASSLVELRRADLAGPSLDNGFDADEAIPGFTVRRRVGRLIEIRVRHLRAVEQLHEMSAHVVREAHKAPSRPIIFGDYRWTSPFSQDVGDEWSRSMRGFNESVAFSAILLARANVTFNLQIERVVRCAGNPGRRLFYDALQLHDWVAERATTPEVTRVAQLLRETA